MTHDGELCAALPLDQISISVWYCHAHQGWCWTTSGISQTADDVLDVWHHAAGDLGPFDDPQEMVARFVDLLRVMRSRTDAPTV